MSLENKNIVFVDGKCLVCHWLVEFVSSRDKHDIFRFAALQDEFAVTHPKLDQKEVKKLSTVILLDMDGKPYYQSDAIIKIISQIPGVWSNLKILGYIPKVIRDFLYKGFTRIRYVFGRKQVCSIPSKEIRKKIKG